MMLFVLISCVDEKSSSVSPTQGPVSNPDFQGIGLNIKTPVSNSTVLNKFVISGHCSNAEYPIQVTSPALSKTIYSICQADFTWAAAIDAADIGEGSFQVDTQIFDKTYSTSSSIESVTINRGTQVCTNANASDIFANSKSGGDGGATPYIICNSDQFANIRFYPSANFVLGQDIDFANKVIAPIAVPFRGNLDGQGFQISNFIVKDLTGTQISVGLFKYVHGATFNNINFKGAVVEGYQRVGIIAGDWRGSGVLNQVKIQGRVNGVTYVGGLAGLTNTSSDLDLDDVEFEVEVVGTNYAGGVIGYNVSPDATFAMDNSKVLSKVEGNDYIGGVVGRSLGANFTFNNVERVGNVDSMGHFVGGFIGEAPGVTILNSENVGVISSTVDAEDVNIGGLAGFIKGTATITNSSSTATITSGGHYTGGLLGKVNAANITNSYSRGTITVLDDKYDSVTKFVGGLIGGNGLNSTIADSRSFMNFNVKSQYVGGLVGVMNGENSSITNSYYKGNLSAYTSHIGGLVGIFGGNSISTSFSQGDITVNSPTPNAYIGGLAGQTTNNSAVLSRLYTRGDITAVNGIADNVGGIVGYSIGGTIDETFFVGDINGVRSKVGGIAGYTRADITKSYSQATLNASFRYVGGIAGISQGADVQDSFALSNMYGVGEVGGIIGWHLSAGNSVDRTYHIGDIVKLDNALFPANTIGEIVGLESSGTINDSYFASTNTINDHTGSPLAGANSDGVSLTASQLRNVIYYNNFNFPGNVWADPVTGFKLPFNSVDYLYASFDWLNESNQGFVVPEVFSFDPLQRVYPSIFIQDTDVLSDLDQEQLEILDSNDPLQTITQNTMTISIEEPSANGVVISGKKLVYGECGQVGYPVEVSGSLTLNSICQANNRWAAVLDVASLPLGNVTLSVIMRSPDGSSSSNSITRTLLKTDDLCEQDEAISGTFANSYLGANGTSTPYKVCHSGHFANMAYYPNANFEIVNNIDFGGNTINPIQSVFTGTIDGNGNTIRNFVIDKSSSTGVGLFRIVSNATIRDLTIENATVTGYERVGILAGSWSGSGTISDVNVKGNVTGILYTGGVIGLANSSVNLDIDRIETEITVNGNGYTGGFLGHISTLGGQLNAQDITLKNTVAGLNHVGGFIGSTLEPNVTVTNLTQTGNVSGLKENVGGIAGHVRGGNFTNLTMVGDVVSGYMAEEANAGGLIGLVELTTFNMNTATFNGNITAGGDNVGGIVGKLVQGTMTNLQSQGTLNLLDTKYNSVRSYVGGLFGHITEDSTLTNSFSNMDIDVKAQFAGGLVGRFHGENSVFTGSNFSGTIDATTAFIGGVAGFFFGEDFQDNYSSGAVTVSNPTPNAYIGGLLGYANSWTSDYQRIYSTGNVTISNGIADYVGGLIGYFRGGALSECYATGNVTGARSAVGGLVGLHRGSTQYCFASGDVDASFRHAGGLIGYLLNGTIADSFALGNVVAGSQSGGLLGYANTPINAVQNVYATGSISRAGGSSNPLIEFGPIVGLEVNAGAVAAVSSYSLDTNAVAGHNTLSSPLTSAQLESSASYVGYDFVSSSSWRMPSGGFVLPGGSGEYDYPIHEWLGSGSVVQTYGLSGSIAGLNFGSMQLDLNGVEQITINAGETNYSFATQLAAGAPYTVTLSAVAGYEAINCNVSNNNGFMGSANITSINVSCASLDSIALDASNPTIGIGENLQVVATGTLSNAVNMDLSNFVTWSSTNSGVMSVNASGQISGVASGNAVLNADLVGLNASTTVNVFSAIAAATGLGWTQASPHNALSIQAAWTPSVSGNVASQDLILYGQAACAGSPINTNPLLASANTFDYNGTNSTTYSYIVRTTSNDNVVINSACSSDLTITLDLPDAATNVASAAVWVSGNSPLNSPTVTWTNPGSVSIQNVMVGLGSSFGADDIAAFAPIGVNTSHVFANLSLNECSPYFPSVKIQDQFNLESDVATDTIGFRWDNTAPNAVTDLATNGDATESSSPAFTWSDPGDNCALRYYEFGIGTSAAGPDLTGYRPIGNVNSYTAVSGLNGFNLNLTTGQDYYTFVRAVDYANNKATPMVSASWQVIDLQASLPSLILWLDSSDKLSIEDDSNVDADDPLFDGRVNEWLDISGSTTAHNFRSVSTDSEPYFSNDTIFFNGANHFMTANNHPEINTATLAEKNISFAFRTENNINNTQVIYEEGGTVRGMNIYISGGNVYCGFWNVTDDGDGAQPFVSVSAPITRNKTYSISWVLDYSNYTGAAGADGSLECFLNGNSIGSASTTTRVFPHSGAIGIGGMYNDTYYHTGAAIGNGDFFRGDILEVMITNVSVDNSVIDNIHNYMLGKWASEDLSKPNNLAINNNSAVDRSASATWEAIDPGLMTTAYYEVAIGQTPGGTEDMFWTNIGNVLNYQVVNGVDGISLALSPGIDYYYSVRAVDSSGSPSQVATSDSWRIFDFATEVTNIVLSMSALDNSTILDGAGNDADNGSFDGFVREWIDTSTSTFTHTINQTNTSREPAFDSFEQEVVFDGVDDGLNISNSDEINTALLDQKNITIQFKTSSDVSGKQVIYEEGGTVRGMNIYITNGKLYCGFWNDRDDGDGLQSFISLNGDVATNTEYVVTWRFDYSNFNGANGEDGKLDCFLNGQFLGSSNTTTRIYPHAGAIGLGYANGGSYYHDTGSSNSTGFYFNGSIKEVLINNTTMRDDAIQGLHNFLNP